MRREECIAENVIVRNVACRLRRGHRRLLRHHPVRRPRVRGSLRRGLPGDRRSVRGDRSGPGAARGAAPASRDLARVPRARRQRRGVEAVGAMARGAQQRGARVLPYHGAIAVHRDGDEVTGARLRDERTGEETDVQARVTVNAAGAWAGRIAEMAGIEGVRILPGRGIMIAMNHRLVNTVINRCTMPSDGDIIVPIRTVSVIGTTDVHTEDPDDHTVHRERGRRDARGGRDARARLQARRGRCACGPACARSSRTPRPPTPTRATSRARTRCSTTRSATASSAS